MSRSTTRYINFRRLAGTGPLAPTILRLMMACNDLVLVEDAFSRIRHNITFHYGAGVVEKALHRSEGTNPEALMTMSMGRETLDWFFEPGDRIVDRIVVRDIFAVPPGTDIRSQVDAIVVRLHEIVGAFIDFAGYFIWAQTQK